MYWLRRTQSEAYANEIKYLSNPPACSDKVPDLVKNLNLFFDESGLLRAGGRLNKCDSLNFSVRNPILLPKISPLTNLIISDSHQKCMHLGTNSTLAAVRNEGFWIPRGRTVVKQVIKSCTICKKFNSIPFKYPNRTDFIGANVNFVRPFMNVGIDYTGHFNVKLGKDHVKMYILLFTCLNVRAVHLELVKSMSSTDFLMAFIRFSNRYGLPNVIFSDNAPTFIQSAQFLKESSSDCEYTAYLSRNDIKHVRIPLYAAWWGSSWERLIRVVKTCLYKAVGRGSLDYFSFITILSDVQNSINSRPLTYQDPDDLTLPISPNSFVKLGANSGLVFGDTSGPQVPAREELVESLERRDLILQKYRDLWYSDYLLSLRENSRDIHQRDWHDQIKVNDIILISSPTKPRPLWQLGRVVELFRGNDGKTRSVEIIRPDRTRGTYAISHLYPMELSAISVPSVPSNDAASPTDTGVRRVRRAAAQRCLEKIKNCD